jgi:hypothetical protein
MIINEAILKSINEIGRITNYLEVYNHILEKKYYDFGASKTPVSTISSQLGEFIRNGDTKIKRVKQEGGTYCYYLTKNEQAVGIDVLTETLTPKPPLNIRTYLDDIRLAIKAGSPNVISLIMSRQSS